MSGWISLHRKIQEHWLYPNGTFSKYEAWLDLLLQVNHEAKKVMFDDELIEVERGQRITSIRKLSDRWKWSRTKVVNFLNLLENEKMITLKKDSKKTVITVENYDFYQSEGNEKRQQKDTGEPQESPNNNENNDNKEKILSEIKDLQSQFSSEVQGLLKQYWTVIKKTRKTGTISNSVILKTMKNWTKYDDIVIQYALKTHIDSYDDGERDEKYTLGIMRRTSKEEAQDRLNKVTRLPKRRYEPDRKSRINYEHLEYMERLMREADARHSG